MTKRATSGLSFALRSGGADDKSPFRGWCMRVTPDGQTVPTAYGIRSPGGIGFNHHGDVFYCDNQGLWNGSSSLKHLAKGSFQEIRLETSTLLLLMYWVPNRQSRKVEVVSKPNKTVPDLVPPPIVLPHGKMGNSPAGIECDETAGKFGPFTNQLFVSEQTHSKVHRVFLEKVNGYTKAQLSHFLKGLDPVTLSPVLVETEPCSQVAQIGDGALTAKNPSLYSVLTGLGKCPLKSTRCVRVTMGLN